MYAELTQIYYVEYIFFALENDVKFFILLFNNVHNPVIKFRIHLIEKLPLTSFQSVNSATSFLAFGLYFADE